MSTDQAGSPWRGPSGPSRNRSTKGRYIAAAVVIVVCIAVTRGLVLAASSSLSSEGSTSATTLATLAPPTTALGVEAASSADDDFRWDRLPEYDDEIAADLMSLDAGSTLSLTLAGDPLSDGRPVVRGALTGVVVSVSDLIYAAQRPDQLGTTESGPVPFQMALPSDAEVNSSAARAAASAGTVDLEAAFQNAAAMEGVPVDLLKAISWVESRWRPDARSYVGAMGMMQLMPRTAEWLSTQIGGSPAALNPWNPEHNIRMGARFIAYLIQWANGDLERALIAYNQGPGSLVKSGAYPSARRYAYMVMELRARFGGPIFTAPATTEPPATEPPAPETTSTTNPPVSTSTPASTSGTTTPGTSAPATSSPTTAPATSTPTTAPATTSPTTAPATSTPTSAPATTAPATTAPSGP